MYGSKKLGLVNNNKYAINIDSELDYLLAKLVLKQKLVANKDLPSLWTYWKKKLLIMHAQ